MKYLLRFILIHPLAANAILCYTCSYLHTYLDSTCLNNAQGAQLTNCSEKYCTITRQELVKNGLVLSFLRDCQAKPQYLNAVKVDADFKTYYRSCSKDLCNESDGKQIAGTVVNHYLADFGAAANTVIKTANCLCWLLPLLLLLLLQQLQMQHLGVIIY